jgi:hypothetical protein
VESGVVVDRISLSSAVFEDLLRVKLVHHVDAASPRGSWTARESENGEVDGRSNNDGGHSNKSSTTKYGSKNLNFLTEEEQQKLIEEASAAIFQDDAPPSRLGDLTDMESTQRSGRASADSSGCLKILIDDSNFDDPLPQQDVSTRISVVHQPARQGHKGSNNGDEHAPLVPDDDDEEEEDEDFTIIEEIIPGKDFRVTFTRSPLGLTLTRSISGTAEVTKVVENGQAAALNVQVGDILVGVELSWVRGYEEAMALLMQGKFPIGIVFRRAARKIESRSPAPYVKAT